MNRREFKQTTTILAFTAHGRSLLAEDGTKKDDRPNILFIMTDQQHAGMLSYAGNQWLKTPALDSLAREGILVSPDFNLNPLNPVPQPFTHYISFCEALSLRA